MFFQLAELLAMPESLRKVDYRTIFFWFIKTFNLRRNRRPISLEERFFSKGASIRNHFVWTFVILYTLIFQDSGFLWSEVSNNGLILKQKLSYFVMNNLRIFCLCCFMRTFLYFTKLGSKWSENAFYGVHLIKLSSFAAKAKPTSKNRHLVYQITSDVRLLRELTVLPQKLGLSGQHTLHTC